MFFVSFKAWLRQKTSFLVPDNFDGRRNSNKRTVQMIRFPMLRVKGKHTMEFDFLTSHKFVTKVSYKICYYGPKPEDSDPDTFPYNLSRSHSNRMLIR
jgi:hypothetical protein